MIDIYQPNDVPRWRKRMDGYSELRRNILYVGGGAGFSKMATNRDYTAGKTISVIAPPLPVGSGEGCCCCECIQAPGGGGAVCNFGTTPHKLMLVASGISVPGTCFSRSGGIASAQGSGPDPNITTTLSHSPPIGGFTFCCDWGTDNPGPIPGGSITYYSDPSCTTVFATDSFEGSGWAVGYSYDSSTGKYYRVVDFISTDGTTGENFYSFVNYTEIFPLIDCSETITVSNQAVFGTLFTPPDGGASNYAFGSGGSVVISPA